MSKINLDFDAEPDASNSSYDKSLSMEIYTSFVRNRVFSIAAKATVVITEI